MTNESGADAAQPHFRHFGTSKDMIRARHILTCLLFLSLFLTPAFASAKVNVVATLGDLAAVAEQVGGEDVEVELLASPQEDPHFVDAKPSYVRRVADADLLLYNGMSLEVGWLPTLIEGSNNGDVQSGQKGHFDASEHIEKKGEATGKVSRSKGDVHPEGNPHYTVDPRQTARVAVALGKRLGEIDPDNADAYRKRAKEYASELLKTGKYWEKRFEEIDQSCRKVVVYHEAWDYLLDWLSLESAVAVEPKPGVSPNPKHVAKVLEKIKSEGIAVLIQMEYYPNKHTKMLAERGDARLIEVDGQTREGDDYVKRIYKLAATLHSAISSRCNGGRGA